MRPSRLFLFGALSASILASSDGLRNSNHIFNAIHSSMRQWGSSLNHNGMSFFVAEVPAGTQLYHGQPGNATVTGMEWLAFEPEHALLFAFPRKADDPHRPGEGPHQPPPHKDPHKPPPKNLHWPPQVQAQQLSHNDPAGQIPMHYEPEKSDNETVIPGWLKTYNTKRDLKFLYIDGSAAAKSDKGTLDTQDYLLLDRLDHTDPFWELERAQKLCALIQDEWGSDLAGIIRMEAGFEIIMCNFADTLDILYETAVVEVPPMFRSSHFAYMHAVASRNYGIGEGRVRLDYERMVTAYKELDMPERNEEQRLNATSRSELRRLKEQVKQMALDTTSDRFGGVDWQAAADMIVLRWKDWLKIILTPRFSGSKDRFEGQLLAMLRPFSSGLAPNASEEAQRCSRQHLTAAIVQEAGRLKSSSLAQQAVTSIAERICNTVTNVTYDTDAPLQDRVRKIQELVEHLRWTAWKECKGCEVDEVCMTAAFPFGSAEDHFHPSCKNETTAGQGSSYWIDRRWGPRNLQSLSMHGKVAAHFGK